MIKRHIHKYQQVSTWEKGRQGPESREALVLKYAPLVKYIADRLAMRLPPHIDKEDLIGAGTVGLFDALAKFDSGMGIKFETYAEHRIRGAMLDELRKMDWIPRSVRKDIRRIEDAILALSARLGKEPEDFEVAREMGMDMDSYHKMMGRVQGVGLLSLDQMMPNGANGANGANGEQVSESSSPYDEYRKKELKQFIARALRTLSKREQLVLSLYYYDDLTLKEIAQVLHLTESRICQIHSKAIMTLRARLRAHREG